MISFKQFLSENFDRIASDVPEKSKYHAFLHYEENPAKYYKSFDSLKDAKDHMSFFEQPGPWWKHGEYLSYSIVEHPFSAAKLRDSGQFVGNDELLDDHVVVHFPMTIQGKEKVTTSRPFRHLSDGVVDWSGLYQ